MVKIKEAITNDFINDYIAKNNLKSKLHHVEKKFSGGRTRSFIHYTCECGMTNRKNWDLFKNNDKCNKCTTARLAREKVKYTKEDIITILDKFNYELLNIDEYKDSGSIMKLKCINCKFIKKSNLSSLVTGKGKSCKKCIGMTRKTNDEFKVKFTSLMGEEYELLSTYIDAKTDVKVKHLKCNIDFKITPINIYGGKRCPKCKSSKGEQRIHEYLNNVNIKYKSQYIFEDCTNNNLKYKPTKLRFDFAIFKDEELLMLIEYDGEQHYIPVNFGGVSNEVAERNFEHLKMLDTIKNKYCEENNIKLLRIPYWEFSNIEKILNDELIKGE